MDGFKVARYTVTVEVPKDYAAEAPSEQTMQEVIDDSLTEIMEVEGITVLVLSDTDDDTDSSGWK